MSNNTPSQNIVSFGKKSENLMMSIQVGIIGTNLTTTPNYINNGTKIFFHCRSLIWGSAEVCSDYFYDTSIIWKDKTYPHRFKIKNIRLTSQPISLVEAHYNIELRERFGPGWAFKLIFAPKPLPADIGVKLTNDLSKRTEASLAEVLKILTNLANKKKKALKTT